MNLVSHVTIGTRDLDATIAGLNEHGLAEQRYPGGACLPVGPLQYIEVQQADPHGRPLQRWIDSLLEPDQRQRWCAWAVAVDDLATLASDHGLPVSEIDQRDAGEGFAKWAYQLAGGDVMRTTRGVAPYFIRYLHDAAQHEAILRERVGGRVDPGLRGFLRLEVNDPDGALATWPIPHTLTTEAALAVDSEQPPGVRAVTIRRDGEPVTVAI